MYVLLTSIGFFRCYVFSHWLSKKKVSLWIWAQNYKPSVRGFKPHLGRQTFTVMIVGRLCKSIVGYPPPNHYHSVTYVRCWPTAGIRLCTKYSNYGSSRPIHLNHVRKRSVAFWVHVVSRTGKTRNASYVTDRLDVTKSIFETGFTIKQIHFNVACFSVCFISAKVHVVSADGIPTYSPFHTVL